MPILAVNTCTSVPVRHGRKAVYALAKFAKNIGKHLFMCDFCINTHNQSLLFKQRLAEYISTMQVFRKGKTPYIPLLPFHARKSGGMHANGAGIRCMLVFMPLSAAVFSHPVQV